MLTPKANMGHAIVIHANNGTKIGCGTLKSTVTMRADVSFYTAQPSQYTACNKTITQGASLNTLNQVWP